MRLIVPLLLSCALFAACSSRDEAPEAATPTPERLATAEATSTPTTPTTVAGNDEDPGAEPSADLALAHLRHIAVEIGERVAGSEGELEVAAYVAEQLRAFGYTVDIQEFEFEGNRFPNGQVSIGDETLDGIALSGSAATAASGRLVYAGLGTVEEFTGLDAEGAIAVVDRGDTTFGEKYQNAIEAGAIAVVIVNDRPGPLVAGNLGFDANHAVVGLSPEQGLLLLDAAAEGVSATVRADGRVSSSVNVLARVNGGRCVLLVGGHHDTVPGTPGANDNASGTAMVIEIARAMAADGLDEGLCFATFGAEESGLFGSREMAAQLREQGEPDAMVNLDVTGRGLPVEAIGDADLIGLAIDIGAGLGIETVPSSLPANAGSDHMSFSQTGSRVLFFASGDFSDIHTPRDTFERIEPEAVGEVLAVAHATVRELYLQLAAP